MPPAQAAHRVCRAHRNSRKSQKVPPAQAAHNKRSEKFPLFLSFLRDNKRVRRTKNFCDFCDFCVRLKTIDQCEAYEETTNHRVGGEGSSSRAHGLPDGHQHHVVLGPRADRHLNGAHTTGHRRIMENEDRQQQRKRAARPAFS